MAKKLQGVLPVLQTPFHENGSIDYPTLEREVDWAYSMGADGVGTGMVSEILRLNKTERIELTNRIGKMNQGMGAYFCSAGAETVKEALEFAKASVDAGADAIMAIPPTTLDLNANNLLEYYRSLAREITIPMIVQDASGYVGQPIPMEVYLVLLQDFGPEKILFKPEAPPIGGNLSLLRDATNGQARIFEGSGGIFLVDSFRRGIVGTIPGMDLLAGIVALWKALQQGDTRQVYALYLPICAIVALEMQAGLDGFLAVEKYFLCKLGVFKNEIRRPPIRWEMDQETGQELDRLYAILEVAMKS
ncbi:MAG: dihydrodipicolinate synthase family protein [Gemmataceae bacterium]|nr:dihydrodipicolinate synthase family protein [Gemmataceae bacterium]